MSSVVQDKDFLHVPSAQAWDFLHVTFRPCLGTSCMASSVLAWDLIITFMFVASA